MNKTEHLLTCLMEECAEIQKDAAKALRFGLDDHGPDAPEKTNAEGIAGEYVDLIAIIEMLEDENIIPMLRSPERIQKKKDKILKYMKYAQERGSLATEE